MSYRLGIELGRTHTTAVVVRDGEPARPARLTDKVAIETALYVERHGAVCAGERAQRLAADEPDRMIRGFLDRIGSAEPMTFGSGPDAGRHHAQDVTAALVAWVVARVAELEEERPAAVSVSMPTDLAERATIEPLKKALAAQGMTEVRVLGEYIAAGRLYTHAVQPTPDDPFVVLVVGSDSVRAAVLTGDPGGKVRPLGRPLTRAGVGSGVYDEAVLCRAMDAVAILGDVEGEPIDADAWRAACRSAREQLAVAETAEFTVSVGEWTVPVVVDREELEAAIEVAIGTAADLVESAVSEAGLSLADVTAVLLCGAAADTPLLGVELAARLSPEARLIREPNPAFTVATGAAFALAAPVMPVAKKGRRATAETAQPHPAPVTPAPAAAAPAAPIASAPAAPAAPTPVAATPAAAAIADKPEAATETTDAVVDEPVADASELAPVAVDAPAESAAASEEPAAEEAHEEPVASADDEPVAAEAPARPVTPVVVDAPAVTSAPVAAPTPPGPVLPRPSRPLTPALLARVSRTPVPVGTGRPIRPNESKDAPRRDQARLLGLDHGSARSATAVLCAIPGREIGTIEDLLQAPAAQYTESTRRSHDPADETAWVESEAEFSEIEDHIVDERTLGQRLKSMATPVRVVTLTVLTVVVVAGTGAWIPIH